VETKANIIIPAKEEPKTLVKKISDFISSHKTVFLAVAAAIVVILLGAGAYTLIHNTTVNNSSRAMEEVRSSIATWNQEEDETKKAELETSLLADLDTVIKKWPRTFAAQQALYTKAGFYASKEDWANAETASTESARILPKSYLVPLALEAAAVAAEEQGKADEAFGYYTRIVTDFKTDTPNLAHAYFSLGRLSEAKSEWKTALEHYQKLLSDFADTDWAKLSQDRVLFLKAKGLDL